MNKIFKQLSKLFPDKMIEVRISFSKYGFDDKLYKKYTFYIAGFTDSFKEFNTLKELDTFLSSTIAKYKKIY